MTDRTTIYAPATAPGRAGVAVIRVSGPDAAKALDALTGLLEPAPRVATLARIVDPDSHETLDKGLVLWFPGPDSFTGEDVVELHLHGGRAVVDGVMAALGRMPGCRPAEAGEFTRRAFDNGKLDLTGVEALADLVDAETAAQRSQALRQMDGSLKGLTERWREELVGVLAHWEAAIDFVDEADVPEDLMAEGRGVLSRLAEEMRRHLADGHRGERLRDGIHVAIVGAPNAGKSSLLNRLARRDAAIVSAEAGTTRDVVEVHLDLAGYPVILADTAGLRDQAGAVESEGIRRALARAEQADFKIAVFDGGKLPDIDVPTAQVIDDRTLVVVNKADVLTDDPLGPIVGRTPTVVSALTGAGVDELVAVVSARVQDRYGESGPPPVLTRARHRAAVGDCAEALDRALLADLPELACEDLRLATRALGRIVGQVDVEELLDVIFHDFCIGK